MTVIHLPGFLSTLEFWNLVIAVLALLIALYSLWYTHKKDQYIIEVVDYSFNRKYDRPFLLNFSVFNASNSPVKITDLKLYDLYNNPVEIIEYEPKVEYYTGTNGQPTVAKDIPMDWDYAKMLPHVAIVPSESIISFRYYVGQLPNPIVIRITTNKRVHWFSKSKSFDIEFDKLN